MYFAFCDDLLYDRLMIVKTKAIVLHSRKYGESSKIITVFTEHYGKQTLIAKGARATKSKFGSSIEPMSLTELTYYKKENWTLHTLATTSSINLCKNIRKSLDATVVTMMILESAALTQDDNSENKELFELLEKCLLNIELKVDSYFNIFVYSQLRLVEALGFGLDLIEIHGRKFVDIVLASGSNKTELSDEKYCFRFNMADYDTLRSIFSSDITAIETIEIDKKSFMTYSNFFVKYFSYHLERKFKYKSLELLLL